jgi:hypothetical protein
LLGACGELFNGGFKHSFEVGILRFVQTSGGTSLPLSASAADHSILAATHTSFSDSSDPSKEAAAAAETERERIARKVLSALAVVFVFFVLKAFTIF